MATIAFLIAGTFFFWKEILAAENGRMGRIYSLETGYFLWIASITFLILGSLYLSIKSKLNNPKYHPNSQ
ncbi:hypothetical protein CQ046_08180 [Chryseobacterium sp. MYb7]|nr:hypothetical protein CQ046_08180 [Chryseobacterium sp. MYb7]